MADATTYPQLKLFLWGTTSAPNPELSATLENSATAQTAKFTSAPLDSAGAVITGDFLFGVRNKSGFTEICYVPAAGMSGDGLTATGVIRGINTGATSIDYTTSGGAGYIAEHPQGSTVFCAVSSVHHNILADWVQGTGDMASGGTGLVLGDETDTNVTIKAALTSTVGFLRKNATSGKAQYSNDGAAWVNIDSVSASNLLEVSAADTTPGYLNTKFNAGDGIDSAIGTPAGDETLDVSVDVSDLVGAGIEDDGSNNFRINVDATTNTTEINGSNELAVKLDPAGGLTTSASGIAATSTQLMTEDYVYGDTIAVNDVLYLDKDDNKLKVIAESSDTWQNIVGVALESGVDTDTGKQVLLKGKATGSFSAVNPSFALDDGTSDVNLNNASARRAFAQKIDNSDGAECEIASVTIPLKKTGTPTTLTVAIVMGDSTGVPNFELDTNTGRGSILGSGTQASAPISGVFADTTITFGSPVRIPANCQVFLVAYEETAVDAGNYFQLEGKTAGGTGETLSHVAGSWWDTAQNNGFNYTLNATSVDPWDEGYAVRCFGGTGTTISIGEQANTRAWSRIIGRVLSATEWFFDPSMGAKETRTVTDTMAPAGWYFDDDLTLGFRPCRARVWAGMDDDGAATYVNAGGVLEWHQTHSDYGNPIPCSGTLGGATDELYQDDLNLNDSKWEIRVVPMEQGMRLWLTRENTSGQDAYPANGNARLQLEFTQE